MTFDQFLAKLDTKNPWADTMASSFRRDHEAGVLILERKGRDLVEVVQRCKEEGLYPVVDKKLGIVFGCETHGLPRTHLFRYYFYATHPFSTIIDSDESADRYISEGYGWFISKMRPDTVMAGIRYRADQFDKDVFEMYKVDAQDLDGIEAARRLRRRGFF